MKTPITPSAVNLMWKQLNEICRPSNCDVRTQSNNKRDQFHSLSALQLVANVSIQLLILDLCMSFGFTTIVIAALMDAKDVEGSDELKINSHEASWLGNGCHEVEGSTVTNCHGLVIMSRNGGGRGDVDEQSRSVTVW